MLSEENQMLIVNQACGELRNQTEIYRDSRPPLAVSFGCKMFIDGDKWCCLYGEDIQNGVAGFGNSPAEAAYDFDRAWHKKVGE